MRLYKEKKKEEREKKEKCPEISFTGRRRLCTKGLSISFDQRARELEALSSYSTPSFVRLLQCTASCTGKQE
jgi:hypothetical protein